MSDQPNDYPTVTARPDAAPTPSVDGAFLALDQQLGLAAMAPGADLDRCTAFRKTVREVGRRWQDGSPAPVMRAKKAAATQPGAGEPEAEG